MHIPPGYANIRFMCRHNISGNEAIWSMGCGLEAADPVQVLIDIEDEWIAHLDDFVHNAWDGENLQLVVGTSNPEAPLIYNHGPWVGGSFSGDPMPPNVSYIVNKRTGLGGRKGRGRMFFPSPGEAAIDSIGRVSSTQKTAFDAALGAWLTAMNGIAGISALYLLHTNPADTPTEITSLDVSPIIGQQKRRLR